MTGARLPRLSGGWHATPADGWCLMELASVLAGEVWSDRPAAVHPVLASVARCVNDESGPAGRRRLLPFAVSLLGTAGAAEPVSAQLVVHCVRRAGAWYGRDVRRLAAHLRIARYLLDRNQGWPPDVHPWPRRLIRTADRVGLTAPAYRHVIAPAVVAEATKAIAVAAGEDRDDALHGLLADCTAICRGEYLSTDRARTTVMRGTLRTPGVRRVPLMTNA
jgi:hypothetical protein